VGTEVGGENTVGTGGFAAGGVVVGTGVVEGSAPVVVVVPMVVVLVVVGGLVVTTGRGTATGFAAMEMSSTVPSSEVGSPAAAPRGRAVVVPDGATPLAPLHAEAKRSITDRNNTGRTA
jgi:hypothetical protein